MNPRRHLVLGGGGFIGSHLCKRLVTEGHDVTAVDVTFPAFRKSQYTDTFVPTGGNQVRKVQMDLRSWGRTASLFSSSAKYDVVWQLAADMGGVEYFHSSADWQAAVNNQIINVNVMRAITQSAITPRVVFTSTACALATELQTHAWHKDHPDRWPLKEEEDLYWGTPDQLYGQEKRNSALLWDRSPMDTRVCFLHTVYGPYQEHSGIRMKFPSAVAQKARRARDTGTIELLGDGRQVRTYMYVDDAVERLLALGNAAEDPGFVNIGGVEPFTVDEVAELALHAAGVWHKGTLPSDKLIHIDGPTGVEARAADMTKFNTAFPGLNTTPMVSLDEGMRRFIDWLDEVD